MIGPSSRALRFPEFFFLPRDGYFITTRWPPRFQHLIRRARHPEQQQEPLSQHYKLVRSRAHHSTHHWSRALGGFDRLTSGSCSTREAKNYPDFAGNVSAQASGSLAGFYSVFSMSSVPQDSQGGCKEPVRCKGP